MLPSMTGNAIKRYTKNDTGCPCAAATPEHVMLPKEATNEPLPPRLQPNAKAQIKGLEGRFLPRLPYVKVEMTRTIMCATGVLSIIVVNSAEIEIIIKMPTTSL